MTVQLPVQSNFVPYGNRANVVGGQRVSLTSVGHYDDTRTSAVSPTSGPVVPGRVVAYDATGSFDNTSLTREPRRGIKAVAAGFVAADFAGLAIKRPASPVRGNVASAQTVNDTQNSNAIAGDVISRAVENEWWFEYNNSTVPGVGAAVQVETSAGNEGRVALAGGVALPTTVAYFTGRLEVGLDGKFYASVNIPTKLV